MARKSKNGEKKCEKKRPREKTDFHPFHESRCNFCPSTSLKVIDSDLKISLNAFNLCLHKVIRDIPTWVPKIPMKYNLSEPMTPK